MPARKPRDRDLVQQLAAVRKLAEQVPVTLDEAVDAVCLRFPVAQPHSPSGSEKSPGSVDEAYAERHSMRRLYRDEDMGAQIAWAKTLRSDTGDVVLRALEEA